MIYDKYFTLQCYRLIRNVLGYYETIHESEIR